MGPAMGKKSRDRHYARARLTHLAGVDEGPHPGDERVGQGGTHCVVIDANGDSAHEAERVGDALVPPRDVYRAGPQRHDRDHHHDQLKSHCATQTEREIDNQRDRERMREIKRERKVERKKERKKERVSEPVRGRECQRGPTEGLGAAVM